MHDRGDWDERELDDRDSAPGELSERGPHAWLPWVLWSLLPLGLLALWLVLRGREPSPSSPPDAPAPIVDGTSLPERPSDEATGTEPEVELPPLSESDGIVRDLASRLSDRPYLASLLAIDDLARKLVVSVANVAEGKSPARQLAHLRPEERFTVIQTAERLVIDPESYRRYDVAAELFVSLEPDSVAKLYRVLRPLLEEAHAELGLADRRGFDDTLSRAIAVLTSTPIVEGPIPLRAVSVSYAFEDPRLEGLAPAQKHFLRMGPENRRRIQKKLAEIAAALGLEAPQPS